MRKLLQLFSSAGILVLYLILFIPAVWGQPSVYLNEDFQYPDGPLPGQGWCEGVPAKITNGHLFVDADTIQPRVSTIWLDKEFEGDLCVEFDVHVVSSQEISNNLNFFLLFSHPSGKPLRESVNERTDGHFQHYHQLKGYIFTHIANGNESPARFRFRFTPGFKLLHEVNIFECRQGITYHVKIEKKGHTFIYWVDDLLIYEKNVDNPELIEKGIIGFRTYRTSLWWDNLTVTSLN